MSTDSTRIVLYGLKPTQIRQAWCRMSDIADVGNMRISFSHMPEIPAQPCAIVTQCNSIIAAIMVLKIAWDLKVESSALLSSTYDDIIDGYFTGVPPASCGLVTDAEELRRRATNQQDNVGPIFCLRDATASNQVRPSPPALQDEPFLSLELLDVIEFLYGRTGNGEQPESDRQNNRASTPPRHAGRPRISVASDLTDQSEGIVQPAPKRQKRLSTALNVPSSGTDAIHSVWAKLDTWVEEFYLTDTRLVLGGVATTGQQHPRAKKVWEAGLAYVKGESPWYPWTAAQPFAGEAEEWLSQHISSADCLSLSAVDWRDLAREFSEAMRILPMHPIQFCERVMASRGLRLPPCNLGPDEVEEGAAIAEHIINMLRNPEGNMPPEEVALLKTVCWQEWAELILYNLYATMDVLCSLGDFNARICEVLETGYRDDPESPALFKIVFAFTFKSGIYLPRGRRLEQGWIQPLRMLPHDVGFWAGGLKTYHREDYVPELAARVIEAFAAQNAYTLWWIEQVKAHRSRTNDTFSGEGGGDNNEAHCDSFASSNRTRIECELDADCAAAGNKRRSPCEEDSHMRAADTSIEAKVTALSGARQSPSKFTPKGAPLPDDSRNNRAKREDFPKLKERLEVGFVKSIKPCGECQSNGYHCTFGTGYARNGRDRLKGQSKCDLCAMSASSCSLYRGNSSKKTRLRDLEDAYDDLLRLVTRNQSQNMSEKLHKKLVEKIGALGREIREIERPV